MQIKTLMQKSKPCDNVLREPHTHLHVDSDDLEAELAHDHRGHEGHISTAHRLEDLARLSQAQKPRAGN